MSIPSITDQHTHPKQTQQFLLSSPLSSGTPLISRTLKTSFLYFTVCTPATGAASLFNPPNHFHSLSITLAFHVALWLDCITVASHLASLQDLPFPTLGHAKPKQPLTTPLSTMPVTCMQTSSDSLLPTGSGHTY